MEAIRQAVLMLLRLDSQLVSCVSTSIGCSVAATLAAVLIGMPIAMLLGRRSFRLRRPLLIAAHTGMAVPTVVIGLVFYGLLSRSGPAGKLGLLYTPQAIILGEFFLALPVIVALFSSTLSSLDASLEKTVRTLGGGRWNVARSLLTEGGVGLIAATMAAFGRVVSELGIAMMLGGNIKGYTRTMSTAMALEVQKGQFALGLALGMVLLLIALGVNAAAHVFAPPPEAVRST